MYHDDIHDRRARRPRLAGLLGLTAALALSGCAGSTIVHGSRTLIGIELSTLEGGEQAVKVGYERSEALVMPMRTRDTGSGETSELREKPYSVISSSRLATGNFAFTSIQPATFTSIVFLGSAATKFAGNQSGATEVESVGRKLAAE